jgi:hypothetical protein
MPVKAIYLRVREYETGIIWCSGDMNETGWNLGAMVSRNYRNITKPMLDSITPCQLQTRQALSVKYQVPVIRVLVYTKQG